MKSSLLILGVAALLITADAVHTASSKGHGNTIRTAPTMPSVTPMPSTTPPGPILNQGALGSPPEFGSPPVNSGLIGPPTQQPEFGALPGQPGSPSFNSNAALPSQDNPGGQ